MSTLKQQLESWCREHPLQPKVFIAPGKSQARQMLRWIALDGTAWANVHIEMPRSFAAKLAAPQMIRLGLKPASKAERQALLEVACFDTLEAGSYFHPMRSHPSFHRALLTTFDELTLSGVDPERLDGKPFEDPRKADCLKKVWIRYEELLAKENLLDHRAVLSMALDALERGGDPHPGAAYLAYATDDLYSLEKELIGRLPGDGVVLLDAGSPGRWRSEGRNIALFRARGEENEVREAFRRVLKSGKGWDAFELVYTDASVYVPAAYELTIRYGVPCTFEEGIPVFYTRAGRALKDYLNWISTGFESASLADSVISGAIDLKAFSSEGDCEPFEVAYVLKEARIGWGRERYNPCLSGLISRVESGIAGTVDSQDTDDSAERLLRMTRTRAAAYAARNLADWLLGVTPEPDDSGNIRLSALAAAAVEFVKVNSEGAVAEEKSAADALTGLFSGIAKLPSVSLPADSAALRLLDQLLEVRIEKSVSKAGCLHVTNIEAAGYSGRPSAFVVGLDESRHPGRSAQDPVLLDDERKRLGESLGSSIPLRQENLQKSRQSLEACLSRFEGDLTLSYSSGGLLEDRESFPSSILLDAFRVSSGDDTLDYKNLAAFLGKAAWFSDDGCGLDDTDWWLGRLAGSGGGRRSAQDSALQSYPWLMQGLRAAEGRKSAEFTSYDGIINLSGSTLDPRRTGAVISASSLETIGRCPFRYFLSNVLEIQPGDDLQRDPSVWLDAMQTGMLVHEIFTEFMQRVTALGQRPDAARHGGLMEEVMNSRLDFWRADVPPPNDNVFMHVERVIRQMCQTFLIRETERCASVEPVAFEFVFGMPGSAPEYADAVAIEAGEGAIALRGRIDRVDRLKGGRYALTDYKTGGYGRYPEQSPFNRGRLLQHAVYARAWEILRSGKEPGATVALSGYFFPSPQGAGKRIDFPPDYRIMSEALSILCSLMDEGCFVQTTIEDDCEYCDYASVCGKPDDFVGAVRMKLAENTQSPALEGFKRLRKL